MDCMELLVQSLVLRARDALSIWGLEKRRARVIRLEGASSVFGRCANCEKDLAQERKKKHKGHWSDDDILALRKPHCWQYVFLAGGAWPASIRTL